MSAKEKSPMEHALDHIWESMYPGTTWAYPAQVAAHVGAVFREYEEKIRRLKRRSRGLKARCNKPKETP